MIPKTKPIRIPALRKLAKGQECTLHIVGVCNHNPETTVFCHLNESFAGKGMGYKADDIGVFACSECHRAYDEGLVTREMYYYLLRGVVKTLRIANEAGVIKLG